jgi:hypothetical protein
MKPRRRSLRLIRPGLQLRLILVFLGLSALSLLLQYMVFATSLSRVALTLPHDGLVLLDEVNRLLIQILAASFLVFLPVTFVLGILTTHRFAGPIYRFEKFLEQVIRGERPRDCRLRKGDELQDFCQLLNRATEPLRTPEDPAPQDTNLAGVAPALPTRSAAETQRVSER